MSPRRVVLFLLVGAALNAAVAWACSQSSPSKFHRIETDDWPGGAPRDWVRPDDAYTATGPGLSVTIVHGRPYGIPGPLVWQQHERAGFPWRSFSRTTQDQTGINAIAAILRGSSSTPPVRSMADNIAARLRQLPITPCLPGFILNPPLYAAFAWSAVISFTSLIGFRRRRRNQCPRCAYNLAGLPPQTPCPECGRASRPPVPTEPRP